MWLKKSPFIRIVPIFITGLALQNALQLPLSYLWSLFIATATLFLACNFFLPMFPMFRYSWVRGIFLQILFFTLGALLFFYNDIQNNKSWPGRHYQSGDRLLVSVIEPPVLKKNTYRTTAKLIALVKNNNIIPAAGTLMIYFDKTSGLPRAGDELLIIKEVDEIKNKGNPGGFNYQRYCRLKKIWAGVFLKGDDYVLWSHRSLSILRTKLQASKEAVIGVLRSNIPGEKEPGLAEALLIGYKDDLDKELTAAYANTGTVHIIAISGMHLALIYSLLTGLLKPIPGKLQGLRALIIILSLWSFSFLCGAQPSILRSATMFSFLLAGKLLNRKNSVFNSLAASAFLLLCIDPNWLWDPGFQLSYAAVSSILVFYSPISNWYFSSNKIINGTWNLVAVSISAQVLTFPLIIYHFHQFPLLFILSNIVAVPLSGVILIGEIILCSISFIGPLAAFVGRILSKGIQLMNTYISNMDSIPFSTIKNIEINGIQLVILYLLISFVYNFIYYRHFAYRWLALSTLVSFMLIRFQSFLIANRQQRLLIYDFGKKTAVDMVSGRTAFFIGDSSLSEDASLYPSRSKFRVNKICSLRETARYFFGNKKIFILDHISDFMNEDPVDLLLIKGKGEFRQIDNSSGIRQVVLDGSLPVWKAKRMEKLFDSLGIPCHNTRRQGAFVMNGR